jgi:hypothetical protein
MCQNQLGEVAEKPYMCQTATDLTSVPLDYDLLMCHDPTCTDKSHTEAIDKMYNSIIGSLSNASTAIFDTNTMKSSFKAAPGCNDYVKSSP